MNGTNRHLEFLSLAGEGTSANGDANVIRSMKP